MRDESLIIQEIQNLIKETKDQTKEQIKIFSSLEKAILTQSFEITLVQKDYVVLIEKQKNLEQTVKDIETNLNKLLNDDENQKIAEQSKQETKTAMKTFLLTIGGMFGVILVNVLDIATKVKEIFRWFK